MNDQIEIDIFSPSRVVLSRKKGWKMPPNTVKVARPSKWGNPFTVERYGQQLAVDNFRRYLIGKQAIGALDLSKLKGKNLACFCKIGQACHADILLEMANENTLHCVHSKDHNGKKT